MEAFPTQVAPPTGQVDKVSLEEQGSATHDSWNSHKLQGVCAYRGSNKSGHLLSGICALRTSNQTVSVSQIVRAKESDGKAIAGTRGEASNSKVHPSGRMSGHH